MIDVRLVSAADVPDVIRLVTEVLAEFGLVFGEGSQTDAALHELPGSYEGGAFWIARADSGALVGTCGVFPVLPNVYELRKMYLAASTRGAGLGKRMLDIAVDWVRARGGTHVVLDTIHEMQRAIEFYEKHGFVRDDTQIRGSRCTRGYIRAL